MYKFYQLMNGIFMLEFDDRHELAMTFLRVQEFYESPNTDFMGKKFTFEEHKHWYISQNPRGCFNYSNEWSGFNTPGSIINKCYEINNERLDTDILLLNIASICENISKLQGFDSYYLIGTKTGDKSALFHEIAHGLYTTNNEYRKSMDNELNNLDSELLIDLKKIIANIGYGEDTLHDEAHAYLSTGLIRGMKQARFEEISYNFIDIYKQYTKDFIMPHPLFEASTKNINFPC